MEEPQPSSDSSEDRSLKTAESLRALRDQADQTLGTHRNRISEIEVRLNEKLQLITEELAKEQLDGAEAEAAATQQAELLEELKQKLEEKDAEVIELVEQLTAKSRDFEAQLAERDEELEQVLELNLEESQQLEAVQAELESSRQALEDLRAEECATCSQLSGEQAEVQQQLGDLNEQIREVQAQHDAKQAELDAALEGSQDAQSQIEQMSAALENAEQRINELNTLQENSETADEQLEQTRRKFELALADVHKLKRENAELREELLSRPEADDQESPELVSLRAERDALAQRIEELEQTPTPTADTDGQQELEDLQRRFEMAVDDVRQLKQEKAELQAKLESAPTGGAIAAGDEAQDWQAQKARLLASLDAEDQGAIDEARREERATVEGTISITDQIVAEKDIALTEKEAEIAELKTQLETRPAGQATEELREQIASEILADDEAVQAECLRLQLQQKLLDDKLREAELEISVQRATLARDQAALEEKLALLPELISCEDEATEDEKPRRRWLSALGIKDNDDSN